MAENIFKIFPLRTPSRIPSQFFGEIDFGLRHSLDLVPKLNPQAEPFASLIASDYDRLVIQKNFTKLQTMFQHKQDIDEDLNSKPIIKAVPNPANNFCGVCHLRFENYAEHIQCRQHTDNLSTCKGFSSLRALAADIHENYMRVLVLKKSEIQKSGDMHKHVLESSVAAVIPSSPSVFISQSPLCKSNVTQKGCQTSPLLHCATEKKPLRILCAKSRFVKWHVVGKMNFDVDFKCLKDQSSKTTEVCQFMRRELSALSKLAFRVAPMRLNFAVIDNLIDQ